jgi:muramoyltetrapeptide carboxypeptidase
LVEGATIGLVSPAGPPLRAEKIDEGIQFLQSLGFVVKLGINARDRNGFLAGNDSARAQDLMRMIVDPEVDLIMAVRGGYGSMRILPLLSFDLFRQNPKAFLGFSDLTALHVAIYQATKLITFHGPVLSALAGSYNEFALNACFSVLMGVDDEFSLCEGYNEKNQSVEVIVPGIVSASLIGGNLSLLAALQGTMYQPKFGGSIVYIEEVGEAPYRIDRLLTQLLMSGAFAGVKGIAIGLLSNCIDPVAETTNEYRQTARDVVIERLAPLKVPMVIGLPFGHVEMNATIPFGGRGTLDANVGDLIISKAVV